MRLTTPNQVPLDEIRRTIKSGVLGNLIAALVSSAVPIAWAVVLWRGDWELMRLVNVVLVPAMLLAGLIFCAIARAFWHSFHMSLGAGNWLARLARDEAYFNLRSYRNSHFEPAPETVVQIPYAEIESATPITETYRWSEQGGRRNRIDRKHSLELVVSSSTDDLHAAIQAERARQPGEQSQEVVRTKTKFHDLPVYLAGPHRVRIQDFGGLSKALAEHVRLEPRAKIDLNEQLESVPDDQRDNLLRDRGWRQRKAA